jgi:hypothetical protein
MQADHPVSGVFGIQREILRTGKKLHAGRGTTQQADRAVHRVEGLVDVAEDAGANLGVALQHCQQFVAVGQAQRIQPAAADGDDGMVHRDQRPAVGVMPEGALQAREFFRGQPPRGVAGPG